MSFTVRHGTQYRYRRGCRCEECSKAIAMARLRERASAKERAAKKPKAAEQKRNSAERMKQRQLLVFSKEFELLMGKYRRRGIGIQTRIQVQRAASIFDERNGEPDASQATPDQQGAAEAHSSEDPAPAQEGELAAASRWPRPWNGSEWKNYEEWRLSAREAEEEWMKRRRN